MPPLAAAVKIVRVAICLPPPHGTEQAPNAEYADTTQLTGQPCGLHGWVLDKAGQAAPPLAAAVTMARVCVC